MTEKVYLARFLRGGDPLDAVEYLDTTVSGAEWWLLERLKNGPPGSKGLIFTAKVNEKPDGLYRKVDGPGNLVPGIEYTKNP